MDQLIVEEWDGEDIQGPCIITRKLDGILAIMKDDGTIVSKNGKPLYNLPILLDKKFKFAEIFCGSWGETWSIVSASKSPRRQVSPDEIYPIEPLCENLVVIPLITTASSAFIHSTMKHVVDRGDEGLVIVSGDRLIKVKPVETVDVEVLGLVKSTAKSHYGHLKEFITEKGKVGIGLTRAQRKEYVKKKYIGSIIEVEVKGGYTKKGKFRSASFVRLRPDKTK